MGKNEHIVPTDGGWSVRGDGSGRATSDQKTQSAAINAARDIAKNQKTELVVHGRHSTPRDKDGCGNDPCQPKDRKY
jgi:hypothetical protein